MVVDVKICDDKKDYQHQKLECCVENISDIIVNNMFTLQILLYIQTLNPDNKLSKNFNYSLPYIISKVESNVKKIISTFSDKYDSSDVTILREEYEILPAQVKDLLNNYSSELEIGLTEKLKQLSLYWNNLFSSCIGANVIEEKIQKHQRKALLDFLEIETILDLGANVGQYARRTFSIGYKNKIHSFEPANTIFNKLEENRNQLNLDWVLHNIALSNENTEKTFHVCADSACSGFKPTFQNGALADGHPVGEITVPTYTLDSYLEQNRISLDNTYLKIDVEGHDKEVLEGSVHTLEQVKAVEIEARLIYYVEDQWLLGDVIAYLNKFNLYPVLFTEQVTDSTLGIWPSSDLIFIKKDILKEISWMFSFQPFKSRVPRSCGSPLCSALHWI